MRNACVETCFLPRVRKPVQVPVFGDCHCHAHLAVLGALDLQRTQQFARRTFQNQRNLLSKVQLPLAF